MSSMRKIAAALSIVALTAAGCTNSGDDDETTPRPTGEDRVEVVAEFQLVGTISKAFAGGSPPIDVSDVIDEDGTDPTGSPEPTPVGDRSSSHGVLRLDTEDVSGELTDECDIEAGRSVDVYWTEDTRWDGSDVLEDVNLDEADLDVPQFEEAIEDRVAGVAGRVYRVGGTDTGVRQTAAASGCTLVADQIGFEQERTAGTDRPAAARTSAPTATPDESNETDEPTAEPDETKKPKKTPPDTATPTAVQQS